jgi:hypothetical protein
LYQLNEKEQVVRFDKKAPRKGSIFTLLPATKDGNMQRTSGIKDPRDKNIVDLVTVTDKGLLIEAREPEEFIQVPCNHNG